MASWGTQLPVYVTRENADGIVGTYYLPGWIALPILNILWINAFVWGGIAIYEGIARIF